MKTENLKVGQRYKYKDLCGILGIEPTKKANNQRDAQFKELDRYCKHHKEGHSIIIDEIYPEIKAKVDKREDGNNSVYKEDLRLLVLHMLKEDKSQTMLISRSKLFEITSMVNENYRLGQKDIEKLSELLEVPTDFIYDFYSANNSKLKNITDRNMLIFSDSEKLFKVNIVTCVAAVNVYIQKNELGEPLLDSQGNVIDVKTLIYREATEKENHFINKCEYEVRKVLEVEYNKKLLDTRDVYANGLWNEYKKLISKKLKANNIAFYYRAYKVMYNNDIIEELWNDFSKMAFNSHRKELNTKVAKSIHRTIKTNSTNAITSTKQTVKTKLHSDKNYLKHSQTMVDKLVNINAPSLKNELKFEQQNIFDMLTE